MNFVLEAEILAHFGVFEWSNRGSEIEGFWLISPRVKFKNRLDGSKSSPLGTYHVKFEVSSMFRLGCRGGWFENAAAHLIFGGNLYTIRKCKEGDKSSDRRGTDHY